MKKIILLCFVVILSNCGRTSRNLNLTDFIEKKIQVDGIERNFLIYKPKDISSDTKLPVIFVNHGGKGSAKGMTELANFKPIADREKVILVYPNGYKNSWNDGRPTKANEDGVNDINFFSNMFEYIVKNENADPKRVYVTGISNGGFMSARLACELSNKIAAFAVVAATMEQQVCKNCSPKKPVSALFIHGTEDQFVPINGGKMTKGEGGNITSHDEAINKWIKINKCIEIIKFECTLETKYDDQTLIYKKVYENNSTSNYEVISYIVKNGGHTWPGGKQYLSERFIGKTTRNLDACEAIWDFFKKHKRE